MGKLTLQTGFSQFSQSFIHAPGLNIVGSFFALQSPAIGGIDPDVSLFAQSFVPAIQIAKL